MDIAGRLNGAPHRYGSGRGRSLFPLRTLAALSVIAVLGAIAPSALAAPNGAISGTVTNAVTHEAIEGIEVCGFSMSESQEEEPEGSYGCAKTGSHGEYTISGLAAGNFAVLFGWSIFSAPESSPTNPFNFVLEAYNDKFPPGEPTPVSVSAGNTATGIDAELQEGSEISGTITNATTGAPVQGAIACVLRLAGGTPVELLACAGSGANGEYTIRGVPDGEFDVVFFGAKLAAQYYPGKASATEASTVTISAAKEVKTAINAAMQPRAPLPPSGPGPESTTPESSGPQLPGGPLTGPLARSKPTVSLTTARIGVDAGALALVKLACAGTARCHGKLILTLERTARRDGKTLTKIVPLGAVLYSLRHGSKATVRIRLDATARRLLRSARGSLAVRLAITQRTKASSRIELDNVVLVDRKPVGKR